MTPEENYEHQKSSPHVIKEKLERRNGSRENSRAAKLTVTKVMLMKKLINQGKPMKQLVRQFKVTDTQIFRIKRGENWSDVRSRCAIIISAYINLFVNNLQTSRLIGIETS